jgi:hypothetical protein
MRPLQMRFLLLFVLVGSAAAQVPVRTKGAKDDLDHQTARLGPLFAKAQACIPSAKDLTAALDVVDGKLVACAQALTRQEASVFLDPVSYGCWDVDVATGKLALRADKGRSYFACQDGCPGDTGFRGGSIAYDGKRVALQDDTSVKVFERKPDGTQGKLVSTISPIPTDFDATGLDGIYLGGFFLVPGQVFDEQGKSVAKLASGEIRVFDETHAIVVDGKRASVFDLTTKQAKSAKLDAKFSSGPIGLGARAFAMAGRTLVVLDGQFRRERTVKLATCAK